MSRLLLTVVPYCAAISWRNTAVTETVPVAAHWPCRVACCCRAASSQQCQCCVCCIAITSHHTYVTVPHLPGPPASLLCIVHSYAARVASYVSSQAGKDSLSSHVDAVVAKKTMSEFGDFGTPRSTLTGFTGVYHSSLTANSRGCCHTPNESCSFNM